MASLVDLTSRLNLDLSGFQKNITTAIGGLEGLGQKFSSIGQSMLPISGAITGIGAVAVLASEQIDKAFDTIRTGTGAIGPQLQGLQASFKNVFATAPDDAAKVGTAIADLNTRLGLVGAPLEAMATQMLNLARITGQEVGPLIADTTRVFGDWGVATEDQSKTLDFLFRTAQSTGIGINELARQVVQFGAPLRQMGFGLEESAALLGKFEKEGVNAELVMGSLRIALTRFAQAGVTDAGEALKEISEQIKAAGSSAQANAIAVDVFGAKAGPDLAAAIREGRFEVQELLTQLRNSPATINATAGDVASLSERWGQFKNAMTLALEPLGTAITNVLPQLQAAMQPIIGFAQDLAQRFAELSPQAQTFAVGLGAVLAVIAPLSLGIAALLPLLAGISLPVVAAATVVGGLVAAFFAWRTEIAQFVTGIGVFFSELTGGLPILSGLWTAVRTLGEAFFTIVTGPIRATIAAFGFLFDQAAKLFDFFREKGRVEMEGVAKATATLEIATKDAAKETGNLITQQTKNQALTKQLTGSLGDMKKAHKEAGSEAKKAAEEAEKAWRKASEPIKFNIEKLKAWHEIIRQTRVVVSQAELDSLFDKAAEAVSGVTARLVDMGRATATVTASLNASLTAAIQPARDLEAAFSALGIKSRGELQTTADKATEAYNTIRDSGTASAREIDLAWIAMMTARRAALQQQGLDLPAEDLRMLNTMKSQLETHKTTTVASWQDWTNQIRGKVDTLSMDLSKTLFLDPGSFVKKGIDGLKDLGEAFRLKLAEPAIEAVNNLINIGLKALTDAITGLIGKLTGPGGLADAFGKIFGNPAAQTGGSVITNAGGSGGNVAGGVASGISSGVTSGLVGNVAAVVDAFASVLQWLQGRRMEQDIGRIEVTTREIKAEVMNFRSDAWARESHLFFKVDDLFQFTWVKLDELITSVRAISLPEISFAGVEEALAGKFGELYRRVDQVTEVLRAGFNRMFSILEPAPPVNRTTSGGPAVPARARSGQETPPSEAETEAPPNPLLLVSERIAATLDDLLGKFTDFAGLMAESWQALLADTGVIVAEMTGRAARATADALEGAVRRITASGLDPENLENALQVHANELGLDLKALEAPAEATSRTIADLSRSVAGRITGLLESMEHSLTSTVPDLLLRNVEGVSLNLPLLQDIRSGTAAIRDEISGMQAAFRERSREPIDIRVRVQIDRRMTFEDMIKDAIRQMIAQLKYNSRVS